MQDWKLNQEIYHRLTPPGDFIESKQVVYHDELDTLEFCSRYFVYPDDGVLYYPAKSYCVALIYSILLSTYFGGTPIQYLKDPALLYGNDSQFKPYQPDTSEIYDTMLATLTSDSIETSTLLQVRVTVQCFKEEFNVV